MGRRTSVWSYSKLFIMKSSFTVKTLDSVTAGSKEGGTVI